MRALIIIAGILALAGCRNNDQTDNTQNVDENLTAENIVSNDVTAIDAVTGDAANMAAESDVNDIGPANAGNSDLSAQPTNPGTRPAPRRPVSTKPAAQTTTNSASNAASNSTE